MGAQRRTTAPPTGVRAYSSRPLDAPKPTPERKKVTVNTIHRLHQKRTPITVVTAYDYPTGMIVDRGQCDICLVGDSFAMVALGYESTASLTMDEMLHHCRATARGCKKAFKVADLPMGTYQLSPEQALASSFRVIKEGHMEAVKMEGGAEIAESVRRITQAGIPVMGHIGLTPQHEHALGGFRVQGKTAKKAEKVLTDALALQAAGCFSLVIECVPGPVAAKITSLLNIPTIGIGAGPDTSGQVLVIQDMLGVFDRFMPKFCKIYGQFGTAMSQAIHQYVTEVQDRTFPDPQQHTYPMASEEELEEWLRVIEHYKEK
ncbi:cell wall biogenesis and architecture protein [Dimargaris verticillata]|uniref:3-methyl-2-oxobutanoate hydroxymethyltransferase n=1 Tax=Dimargaris verticillata TaxID=2761393 RepID=A0A9W8BB15_9FUNG|nr:cell wall biogenesis and architecture protein [Dimargaris verticillata]